MIPRKQKICQTFFFPFQHKYNKFLCTQHDFFSCGLRTTHTQLLPSSTTTTLYSTSFSTLAFASPTFLFAVGIVAQWAFYPSVSLASPSSSQSVPHQSCARPHNPPLPDNSPMNLNFHRHLQELSFAWGAFSASKNALLGLCCVVVCM